MTTPADTSSLERYPISIPGRDDAAPFDDVADANGQSILGIRQITVHEQGVITGLQVDYLLADGSTYHAPLRGKEDGTRSVITLAPEEALVQLTAQASGDSLASLTFTLTTPTGQTRLEGPFGKAGPGASAEPHALLLGGVCDQGFSFFGARAVALWGQVQDGRPVGLGAYTAPLVSSPEVTSTSVLSEDYRSDANAKEKFVKYSNYRSIVTVPAGTQSVELWAAEELQVTIGTGTYTLDPVKKTTVTPNSMNKVVINIEGTDVSVPALKLKTDRMQGAWQWHAICPDAPVHEKMAGWSADTLYTNREKLGIDPKHSKEECASVQAAVTHLAQLSAPRADEREFEPEAMADANWVLDFSGPTVTYKALTAEEAQALNGSARSTTRTESAQSIKGLTKKAKKGGKVVVSTTKNTAKKVEKEAKGAAEKVEKEAKKAAGEAARQAELAARELEHQRKRALDTAVKLGGNLRQGDFVAFGKDFLQEGLELGLDAVSRGYEVVITFHNMAGEAISMVLDSVAKVGKVISGLLQSLGAAIVRFIEFLCDQFDWKAIIHTQKALVDRMEKSLDAVLAMDKARLKKSLRGGLATLEARGREQLDSVIRSLGGETDPSKLGQQAAGAVGSASSALDELVSDTQAFITKPLEALDWLLSKALDHLPGLKAFKKIFQELEKELGDVLRELGKVLERMGTELASALGDSVSALLEVIENPTQALEQLACAFLQFVKGLLETSIGLGKGILDVMVDALAGLLKFVMRLAKVHIDIPVVSDLYQFFTGQKLTLLNLMTLAVAIPTTLVHLIAFGKAPSFKSRLASSSDKVEDGMAIASGVFTLIESLLLGVLDYEYVLKPAQVKSMASQEGGAEGKDNGSPPFVVELCSFLLAMGGHATGFPLEWDRESADDDASWLWGLLFLAVDGVSLFSEKSRLVRVRGRFLCDMLSGPRLATFLSALSTGFNVAICSKDPGSMTPTVLGEAAGLGEAVALLGLEIAEHPKRQEKFATAVAGWDMLVGTAAGAATIGFTVA